MAWVSFAIVVILFYTPVIGLGHLIQEQTVSLVLYSVGSWFVLWLTLVVLEGASGIDLLSRARLRNGMLYALRPYVGNRLSLALAEFILGYLLAKTALAWIARLVPSRIAPILGVLLPYDLDMAMVVLSILTVIAAYASRLEQRYRYEADIRRNQRQRKRQQTAIIVPTAQQ